MFKKAARPSLTLTAEALSPVATRLRGCPACNLSTGSRSHPIHSTARIQIKRRADHYARTEFWGPGGSEFRNVMSFREFQKFRGGQVRRQEIRDESGEQSGTFEDPASQGLPQAYITSSNLPGLLNAYRSLAESGRTPTKEAYLALLEAASNYSVDRGNASTGDELQKAGIQLDEGEDLSGSLLKEHGATSLGWKLAWCTWEDARRGGIELGSEGFDFLLRAATPHGHLFPSLINYALSNPSVSRNLTTAFFNVLLRDPARNKNIAHLALILQEMRDKGVAPPEGRIGQIAQAAALHGEVKLALDLVAEEEGKYGRSVESQVWADILRCSAERYYLEGVEASWRRTVDAGYITPELGLCTLVLDTAARHHRPDLATKAMAALHASHILPKEYHFPPLIQALCGSGRVSDAMEVLVVMRKSGFPPTLATTEPIVDLLSKTAEDVDKGFYGLQALKTTGKAVDVAAFNAVLKAAERVRDANRAMVLYSQAANLGVTPDAETFHILLSVCAKTGARPQAEHLLKQMAPLDKPLEPGAGPLEYDIRKLDKTSYELLIQLYLAQEDYEFTFTLLEAMKEKKIRPPLAVYESMVMRCVTEDDSRHRGLLEEMQAGGYKPSQNLVEYVRKISETRQGRPGRPTPRNEREGRR